MRLDKLLSHQGLGTRKDIRGLLRAGRVFVDGCPVDDPGHHVDPATAYITVDGAPLHLQTTLHLMLHKPAGVITASEDTRHRTVLDLLPEKVRKMDCMPIGRLDKDTEGLLLLTTDGHLAHRLLSPKRHVDKVYVATLDAPVTTQDVQAFAQGIVLKDFTALPAALTILPDNAAQVTVQEGKFHQVKRMFGACGKHVLTLKRTAFAGIPLDASLAPGAYRELTPAEVAQLYQAGGMKDA